MPADVMRQIVDGPRAVAWSRRRPRSPASDSAGGREQERPRRRRREAIAERPASPCARARPRARSRRTRLPPGRVGCRRLVLRTTCASRPVSLTSSPIQVLSADSVTVYGDCQSGSRVLERGLGKERPARKRTPSARVSSGRNCTKPRPGRPAALPAVGLAVKNAVGVDQPGLRRLPLETQVELSAHAGVAAAVRSTALEGPSKATLDPRLRAFGRVGTTRDHSEQVPPVRRRRCWRSQRTSDQGHTHAHHWTNGHGRQSILSATPASGGSADEATVAASAFSIHASTSAASAGCLSFTATAATASSASREDRADGRAETRWCAPQARAASTGNNPARRR